MQKVLILASITTNFENEFHQFALSNGFNTCYRMLFATAILCNGKAVNFSKLSRRCMKNKYWTNCVLVQK